MSDVSDDNRRSFASLLGPRYWGIWLAVGALRALYLLPFSVRIRLGRRLGRLAHRFANERRRVVETNLALCLPDMDAAERERIAVRHFEDLGISLFEMTAAWWGDDRTFESIVDFDGIEHLEAALRRFPALIVLTGHFSTLEIGGRFLKSRLPPFDGVYRPLRNPLFDELIRRGRLVSGRTLIEKSDIRQMIKNLRGGVSVWYAPDQSFRGKYAQLMDFFGVPTMTNAATGRIAKLGRAGVLPFYCWRVDDSPRYRVQFLPALDPEDFGDPEALTARYVETLEEAIRRAPSQYYWVHRKFKDRPPPLPDVYARES